MEPRSSVVDGILTAILQWRVAWLNEQKQNSQPPPICRTQPRKLKITYDSYKDYETTFVPLIMHEIWAQVFEEWAKLQGEQQDDVVPMEIDTCLRIMPNKGARQFKVGILEYRSESQYQYLFRCQLIVDSSELSNKLKLVGEGDLVRLDLATAGDPNHIVAGQSDYILDPRTNSIILGLFSYVTDVSAERVTRHTQLAECYEGMASQLRHHHVITYNVIIAKRNLKLRLNVPVQITLLYYLKPMIRQIESVALLKESALASDILSPKQITCQMTVPTVISMKSPHYNEMQYKAIVGVNEALVRSIPKIQLIQGPPGTGKTHTLIGIIKYFYLNWRSSTNVPKILICAPSNGAIDEVARRLHAEREFLRKGQIGRSVRLVRIGNPDQISDAVKGISLDELVESNVKAKVLAVKKQLSKTRKTLEDQLSQHDTEIANLRALNRHKDIPKLEMKIAELIKDLDALKSTEETSAKREVSEASRRSTRYELVRNADIILTTLNSCQRHPMDALFKDRTELSFHCVIVDEASQCCEPELLMPLCYRITKMVLIGDPMQLPATVISRHAQEFDFGRSLFERFFLHFGRYDSQSPVTMLTDQYRMHRDICKFPSKQFYDGRLRNASNTNQPYPLKPYIMFDLRHGTHSKSSKSSLENETEAALVRSLLVAIMTKVAEKSSIGVITPYRGQKRLITNRIASLQSQRKIRIDVNTCDGFQGQERDIIILSCVRTFESGGTVGFLKSYQRVNVALTRAKHCLIVCISAKSLTKDNTWKALVEDAHERDCIQTLTHTPSATALETMIVAGARNMRPFNSKEPTTDDINSLLPDYLVPMDVD